jgi:hypothetical protein
MGCCVALQMQKALCCCVHSRLHCWHSAAMTSRCISTSFERVAASCYCRPPEVCEYWQHLTCKSSKQRCPCMPCHPPEVRILYLQNPAFVRVYLQKVTAAPAGIINCYAGDCGCFPLQLGTASTCLIWKHQPRQSVCALATVRSARLAVRAWFPSESTGMDPGVNTVSSDEADAIHHSNSSWEQHSRTV